MPGIQTSLKDLGKSAQKFFQATQSEETRKAAMIKEFKTAFMRQGFHEWTATHLADEKYYYIHKPYTKR